MLTFKLHKIISINAGIFFISGAALLLGSAGLRADALFAPSDPIIASSANVSADGAAANAIDGNVGTKYLNFDKLYTGFQITPGVGLTLATNLELVSGNDTPGRDPANFILDGSNDDGATWIRIASGVVPPFVGRGTTNEMGFVNTATYTSYRITFPNVRNPNHAITGGDNSMQIAEVQLTGVVDPFMGDAYAPVIVRATPLNLTTVEVLFSEPVDISGASASISGGVSVTDVTLSADGRTATLTTTPQTAGTTYTITANGVVDSNANTIALDSTVSFIGSTFSPLAVSMSWGGRWGTCCDPAPFVILSQIDVAGVVPLPNWNNLWMTGNEFPQQDAARPGDTGVLNDQNGDLTTVTLTYAANDAWENDAGTNTLDTPDKRMMYGIIKNNGGNNATAHFTFNNIPEGTFDLYVYTDVNGDGAQIDLSDGVTTHYTIEQHTFGGTFIQALNTDPAGTRDTGNYVKFSNVHKSLVGGGQINLSAHWAGGGDGLGIAGFQLVRASDTYPPTIVWAKGGYDTVSILFSEPVSDAAANTAHYSLNGGLTFSGASLDETKQVVTLTTSKQTKGASYTVTVNGIVDRSPAANPLAANSTATFTPQYPVNLGVNFAGGHDTVLPTHLLPTEAAGVVPTPNFNNLDGNTATAQSLLDSDGLASPVTITFNADERWTSGTFDATHTDPNSELMNGYLGVSNDGNTRSVLLENVPYGTYNLYVYTLRDSSGAPAVISAVGAAPRVDHWVKSQGAPDWLSNPVFVRGTNTSYLPVNFDLCNYVEFENIQPDANGRITLPFLSYNFRAISTGLQLLEVNANPLAFVSQPVNTTVKEVDPFTFTAQVVGALPHTIQWYTNNQPIDGAVNLSYSGIAVKELDGVKFSVSIDNVISTLTSTQATLHVLVDHVAPFLVSASADAVPTTVRLVFSEPVSIPADPLDLSIAFSFPLDLQTVLSAEVLPDLKTVLLTTDLALDPDVSYSLHIAGIKDLAGIPNTISPNPTVTNIVGWASQPSGLLQEWFYNEANPVVDFSQTTNDVNFPCNPGAANYIGSYDSNQTPGNGGNGIDHYSIRIRGYLLPPETGDYLFSFNSDDSGRLWVSPTGPASDKGLPLINIENRCCANFAAPYTIHLEAGRAYYTEAWMEDNGGGDHMNVQWQNTSPGATLGTMQAISSSYLVFANDPVQLNLAITGPADATVPECQAVTLPVAIANLCGSGFVTYQWARDGVDIQDATNASLTIAHPTIADSGSTYHLTLSVVGQTVVSRDATLTVVSDPSPLTVVKVRGDASLGKVYVTYNKTVDPASALAGANYAIVGPGNAPLAVTGDGTLFTETTVVLPTDPQIQDAVYTVTINNVNDLCLDHPIAANTKAHFTAWVLTSCFATWEVYSIDPANANGTVAALTATPTYPDHPRETYNVNSLDSRLAYPDDSHSYYGSRFTATFTAPVDGTYTWYLENDDAAELFIDGASVLAVGCCNGTFVDGASATVTLTAGAHQIQALHSEGGGGDYIRIAVRLPGDTTTTANLPTVPSAYLATFVNPDDFLTLPTSGMLPLGSLSVRGFNGKFVKIHPGITNTTAATEALLAGTYADTNGGPYPNLAPFKSFIETGIINYNVETNNYGHLVPDAQFPGLGTVRVGTSTNTDNMAMEILTYVELQPGNYTWGVNSDDGFRVSPATSAADPNNAITLGEFSGGRGTSDTLFHFKVAEAGLYPMRLIWEQGGGGANVEWWDFACGQYVAINAAAGLLAFQVPELTVSTDGTGAAVVTWQAGTVGWVLKHSPTLGATAVWTPVSQESVTSGDTQSVTIPKASAPGFYRLSH